MVGNAGGNFHDGSARALGDAPAGRGIRFADDAQEHRIHVSCRAYACAGDRSEHRDIQRGARSAAEAASISAGTATRVYSAAGAEGRHRRHGIFGARNRRLSPAEPVARRVGGIPCDVVHSLRTRGSGPCANSGCVGELLRPFRSESFDGADFFAGTTTSWARHRFWS